MQDTVHAQLGNAVHSRYPINISFMCQLDWAMGCLDCWLNIISNCVYGGASERD